MSYLRSTMSQKRFCKLVILPIKNEILVDLELKNIINSNLASQKARKIDLKKYPNINII